MSDGLNVFAAGAARAKEQTPQAYQLQGDKFGFVIYQATTEHLSAVMNGNMTLDEALDRIQRRHRREDQGLSPASGGGAGRPRPL